MTLSTNIYVLDPISPHELFRFCQTLLTEYDDDGGHRPFNRQECYDRPLSSVWSEYGPGAWNIANRIGQGLPAILDIRYRPGAPLTSPEQAEQCTSECDPPGTEYGDEFDPGYHYHHHPRACWLHIDFDTTYGYKDSRGWGCGDLHAVLVARVGQWCDERGAAWEWQNEFTGKIHGGDDRYKRLIDLCRGGAQAVDWFQNMVMPAIAAHAADGGPTLTD